MNTPCSTAICGCYTANYLVQYFVDVTGKHTARIGRSDRLITVIIRRGEKFSERGPNFFKLYPIVLNYVQHIFKGEGRKSFKGASPPLVTDLVTMLSKVTCLRTESNH